MLGNIWNFLTTIISMLISTLSFCVSAVTQFPVAVNNVLTVVGLSLPPVLTGIISSLIVIAIIALVLKVLPV